MEVLTDRLMGLSDFVRESNRIEGIFRSPRDYEIVAHEAFLQLSRVKVEDLEAFVRTVEPEARLRVGLGMDVWVGRYFPPPGGPQIVEALKDILRSACRGGGPTDTFLVHHAYEALHPFTDGNGRSGRVLWLWMMGGSAPLGFLHHWYYQSLAVQPDNKVRR